jgi:DNA-binding NarL/FixJ family response regulator
MNRFSEHTSQIHVGLISDRAVMLEALKDRLNEQADIEVLLATNDIDVAADRMPGCDLQVLVLDTDHSSGRILEFATQFNACCQATQLIFLASSVHIPFMRQALELNTSAYLTKAEPISVVIEAIHDAVCGKTRFSPQVQRWLQYDKARHRFDVVEQIAACQLTERQLTILRRLASGESAKEVAHNLSLSPKSIENYSYRIMRKLGLQDRVQLCRYAIRHGLIEA